MNGSATLSLADSPSYWMAETSGALRAAVVAFLDGSPLTDQHIAVLRAYLRQWCCSSLWDRNPFADPELRGSLAALRLTCDALISREAIALWLERATELGMDPL